MKRRTRIISAISLFTMLFAFSSCNKDDEAGSAQFNIRLTDAPGNYDEVIIDFREARVYLEEAQNWITINSFSGFYDLLKLNNGKDTLIASRTIPTGTITRVWLILGTNNKIKVNGQIRPLVVQSSTQAHVYLDAKIEMENNNTYTLIVDFDAANSVVELSTNQYYLYPQVRVISLSPEGSISGTITPVSATPAIYAINSSDTVSTYPDSAGNFLIRGLGSGTYSVYFSPATGYNDTTVTGISVLAGSTTDMDTIPIP